MTNDDEAARGRDAHATATRCSPAGHLLIVRSTSGCLCHRLASAGPGFLPPPRYSSVMGHGGAASASGGPIAVAQVVRHPRRQQSQQDTLTRQPAHIAGCSPGAMAIARRPEGMAVLAVPSRLAAPAYPVRRCPHPHRCARQLRHRSTLYLLRAADRESYALTLDILASTVIMSWSLRPSTAGPVSRCRARWRDLGVGLVDPGEPLSSYRCPTSAWTHVR